MIQRRHATPLASCLRGTGAGRGQLWGWGRGDARGHAGAVEHRADRGHRAGAALRAPRVPGGAGRGVLRGRDRGRERRVRVELPGSPVPERLPAGGRQGAVDRLHEPAADAPDHRLHQHHQRPARRVLAPGGGLRALRGARRSVVAAGVAPAVPGGDGGRAAHQRGRGLPGAGAAASDHGALPGEGRLLLASVDAGLRAFLRGAAAPGDPLRLRGDAGAQGHRRGRAGAVRRAGRGAGAARVQRQRAGRSAAERLGAGRDGGGGRRGEGGPDRPPGGLHDQRPDGRAVRFTSGHIRRSG